MKKKLKHIDPKIIDSHYYGKNDVDLDDSSEWFIKPTNYLQVKKVTESEYKISWQFYSYFEEAHIFGNPHLVVSKSDHTDAYKYEKKSTIWAIVLNCLLIPFTVIIAISIFEDYDSFSDYKSWGYVYPIWLVTCYFMIRNIYKLILKHVEKQVGKLDEIR